MKGLRVDSFLITPIQRIPKYKLLIGVCCLPLYMQYLPIGYSVIVALTGLPIGYSVIVALTGLPIGYSSSNKSPYRIQ